MADATATEGRHNGNDPVAVRRVKKLFTYLSALNQLGNPPKRAIDDQPWRLWLRDLPEHPAVERGTFAATPVGADGQEQQQQGGEAEPTAAEDFVLRVGRPQLTPPPSPPDTVRDWLRHGWQRPDGKVEVQPSRNRVAFDGGTVTERFEDDRRRTAALADWKLAWAAWAQAERPTVAALDLFERVYALHGQIAREAERVELVLGDGVLAWGRRDGGVRHPLLLQRLQLEFEPQVPRFTFRETPHPVELYTALLRTLPEVEAKALRECRHELEQGPYHPLDGAGTSGFLKRLALQLSAQGLLVEAPTPGSPSPDPVVYRDPVLFLRTRTLGLATALEAILADLEAGGRKLPSSLTRIVGVETGPIAGDGPTTGDGSPTGVLGNEDRDVLFGKPANPEQLQIAQRLRRHGCVLVQGPPGTGKTHTIANLVGDLLAQGKTVLVTSHTTKALRVLREKVVEQLQPLCVSVLESDAEGQRQLESSVGAIVRRLADSDAEQLDREAAALAGEREHLLGQLREARRRLRDARMDEYRPVVLAGEQVTPAEAARRVAAGVGVEDWVPGPVAPGAPVPLGVGELSDLYATNATVPPEDEGELDLPLPDPERLPAPSEFASLVEELEALSAQDLYVGEEYWPSTKPDPVGTPPERLDALLESIPRLVAPLGGEGTPGDGGDSAAWQLEVIAAGTRAEQYRQVWLQLAKTVESVERRAADAHETTLTHGPALSTEQPLTGQIELLRAVLAHLDAGRSLGTLTLLTKPAWKRLIAETRVGDASPATADQFRSLLVLAELEQARRELVQRWGRQVTAAGGPTPESLGGQPERVALQYVARVRQCLDWTAQSWEPVRRELEECGLSWTRFFDTTPPVGGAHAELRRLHAALTGPLPPLIRSRSSLLKLTRLRARLAAVVDEVGGVASTGRVDAGRAAVTDALLEAVRGAAPDRYRSAHERLRELVGLRRQLGLRRELLRRLETAAPGWAAAIRNRSAPHDGRDVPGDASRAWAWRQLHDELEARGRTSLQELQGRIEQLSAELMRLTCELVDRRAWAGQVRRTRLEQRQALMGWLQTIRRIGRGTGKRVPQLRAEARTLMERSRTAVPVWVMPLARVVENFDPARTRFDVVIVDEASQSSVLELVAFYLADEVVVVGDDKQVSPEGVGQDLSEVEKLIDEHLAEVPNHKLYDGQLSLYDLANQAFGGTICLREHFRCASDIIQFSNGLSYDWEIRPLRDVSDAVLRPHVLAYRVDAASASDKVNVVEAEAVASLLVAATEQPEYAGKTFGVVSLVGEEQARAIDELLRRRLPPDAYGARQILCGNAAQFQGDERDVMFLSVVDAPSDRGGPLALRATAPFQKRFNVAASRARDQMWVVHSVDPETDLKPGDLRRRLIEHARDPRAVRRQVERAQARAESEFERRVLERLVTAGYRVTPQLEVGYYRIDIVVHGGDGARLAVECDGDRYHPPEKLEEDMARQAVLERLGLRFVRVRGSQFFRDPERAMGPVFETLRRLGIEPEAAAAAGTAEAEAASTADADLAGLRHRIVARAAELRTAWAAGEASRPDSARSEEDPVEAA